MPSTNSVLEVMNDIIGALFLKPGGGITPLTGFLLLGLPLFCSGQWIYGSVAVLLAILSAMAQIILQDNNEGDLDNLERNANSMSTNTILSLLKDIEQSSKKPAQSQSAEIESKTNKKLQILTVLGTLVNRYNKSEKEDGIALKCQQAGFIILRVYPNDDETTMASIALLALVAKNRAVRLRHKEEGDVYALKHPIQALKRTLHKAKQENKENMEELLAETLRKGCLYLGALADGDKELEISAKIVEEDGLELILDVAGWFRMHAGVVNWALWAVFNLCYDHLGNKLNLVRLKGIKVICESMQKHPQSLEVNRHGVAVLYDLLRENKPSGGGESFDPWEIRRLALAAGLHGVVVTAMKEFSDSVDIMMMGQDMLIGTGYKDDIPQYEHP